MLIRCHELKSAIRAFQRQIHSNNDLSSDAVTYSALKDHISDDDWDEVTALTDFLQLPYELTKRLEGNNSQSGFGSLWQAIPNLQALWKLYSETAHELRHQPDSYFKKAVSYGLTKLDQYWRKLLSEPETSYYCIATTLHPKLRQQWFKTHWKGFSEYSKKADSSIRDVYISYQLNEIDSEIHLDDQYTQPSRRKVPDDTSTSRFDDILTVDLNILTGARGTKKQRRRDELQEYFEAIAVDLKNDNPEYLKILNDPWKWWVKYGRRIYPVLFKIAYDFLSIPSTSCECERCFSTARRTITDDRNRLEPSAVEAVQLQKNWLRHKLVHSSIQELEDLIVRRQKAEGKEPSMNPTENI